MENDDIRGAAESLLCSLSRTPTNNLSHSVNLFAEELAAGSRMGGRMSSVRRFFCLLVTFDLLFTALLWLICVMLPGGNLPDIIDSQVMHYDIKKSMFDIVMVAACKFLLLLFFYALLHINNWSIVAISTTCTCAFLIAKVFVYDWANTRDPVYHVFLILTSFTLAWGEAWFLDLRVLPQEKRADCIRAACVSIAGAEAGVSERSPLLGGALGRPADSRTEYFSPIGSATCTPKGRQGEFNLILTTDKIDEYKQVAQDGLHMSRSLMSAAGWKKVEECVRGGDVVDMISASQLGKVYRFRGIVDCPAKWLYEELRDNFAKMPEWNSSLLECQVVKKLCPGYDITYQVSAKRAIVKERDFVLLRRLCACDAERRPVADEAEAAEYVAMAQSVEVPGLQHQIEKRVRGEIKLHTWLIQPTTHKTSSGLLKQRTLLRWLFSCDLKLMTPEFILQPAMVKSMKENIDSLRLHAAAAKSRGQF